MILNSGKQTLTSRDLSLLRNDGELPKDLLMAVVKSETAQAKRDKSMISWQGDSLRKLISQNTLFALNLSSSLELSSRLFYAVS